jgi:hypothetical protein
VELKKTHRLFENYLHLGPVSPGLDAYGVALWGDPVGCVQKLVSDCRVSGQWCSALRAVIKNGNQMESWPQTVMEFDSLTLPDNMKIGGLLPEVQLLWNCETR